MSKQILIVDDDPHIRDVVTYALEKTGMKPLQASDGKQALEVFERDAPDLLILDIGMPEMDGLEVCRYIRKTSEVPILFLSSRDEEIDRVLGLEIGGDDYVTKPFSPRELVARVNSILKRSAPKASPKADSVLVYGAITMEPEGHTVRWQDTSLKLTSKEFAILKGLLEHPTRVCDRNRIMDFAYGPNMHVSDRTIDSHIRHIRSKFLDACGKAVIVTVHGVGYKLEAEDICR